MKRLRLLAALALAAAAGAVVGGVDWASASVDCPAWVDSETATECIVSATHSPGPGPHAFNKSLHVTATGHIDATDSPTGITLNVNGVSGLDLTMDAGGVIETDDDHLPGVNDPAPPIVINVSGDVNMTAGSRISADNLVNFGTGGDIDMVVGGDMFMGGTPGTDNCLGDGTNEFGDSHLVPLVYADPSLGAVISAVRKGGQQNNATKAGDITITIGSTSTTPPTGTLTTERCSIIDVSSRGAGGEIDIKAGNLASIGGLVLSHSGRVDPFGKGGGPITIITGCGLTVTDTGVVSSLGRDPGADLVHLESCDVIIHGIVQSTTVRTGGHGNTPQVQNRCENDPVVHPLGAAPRFTGCVEVWAKNITIDAGNHHGNVNVNKILKNRGWIDLFAVKDITITGGVLGSGDWAVSAFAADGAPSQHGGLVTVKSTTGKVVTTGGQAIRAVANTRSSDGGQIIVEAGGAGAAGVVNFNAALINATGGQGGNNSTGGLIAGRSFNDTVKGVAPGALDAHSNSAVNPGSVNLTACVATSYTGAITPSETNLADNAGQCGGQPTLPTAPANTLAANAAIWEKCVPPPCE